ncbi:TIR domain-containing protein [Rhodococcus phenolicus]|uniref:TIR domain-containing protein n=1 Tax=Rhodococcus phenolicus TaxID=263849 RepID=UPI00082AD45F|nr:TIR domain-containing protein [Rhodococcus phenolicus]
MADGDLKVFTSWSGDFARDITRVIRDWLPKMLDRVDPWMSDIDIQAGTRALQVIEDRLNESEFGIIVVTTANQHSTWLNFEAGAVQAIRGPQFTRNTPARELRLLLPD